VAGQRPSVGRVVHYVSYGTPGGEYGKECRAAIVTEVSPESEGDGQEIVGLCVLNPTGLFFNRGVVHSEMEFHGGTWHWPERLAEASVAGSVEAEYDLDTGARREEPEA
jgi:hypothetical protein